MRWALPVKWLQPASLAKNYAVDVLMLRRNAKSDRLNEYILCVIIGLSDTFVVETCDK
jgi:hypothetical protein